LQISYDSLFNVIEILLYTARTSHDRKKERKREGDIHEVERNERETLVEGT
jgi:hypothetical protein